MPLMLRDLTVMLAVDISASGDFGSGAQSKRELAAEYPGRRVRYTEAKGDFIDRVTEVAKRGSDERLEGNTPQEVA